MKTQVWALVVRRDATKAWSIELGDCAGGPFLFRGRDITAWVDGTQDDALKELTRMLREYDAVLNSVVVGCQLLDPLTVDALNMGALLEE